MSRLDDALDRGYDPHPDDLLPPAAHLTLADDDPWMVALAASVEEARHLTACDIPDCGDRRCDTCDERMACTGPEPRACLTTCVDCPCRCETCVHVREDMRADLIHRINKEASDGAH